MVLLLPVALFRKYVDGALEMKKLNKRRADICADRAIDYIWQLGVSPCSLLCAPFLDFRLFTRPLKPELLCNGASVLELLQDNQKPLAAGTRFPMYSLILDVKYAVRR